MTAFDLTGTTLEACNCEPICPCRTIDGARGGRSTYGECTGILTWRIETGTIGSETVDGLAVAMAIWYSDDEPGSPWRWALHLDDRGTDAQRAALTDVWRGTLGGTPMVQFPWARKPSDLVAVSAARIELDHTPGRGLFRIGRKLELRIEAPYPTDSAVTCLIPGYDRPGRELVASTLRADDEHFQFAFSGRCGFESSFHYTSD